MAIPTVRRRRLGVELRQLREASDLTLEQVEEQTGLSVSKLSRIESATRGARPADVDSLMNLYGVQDDSLRSFLALLARDGAKRGWWQTYDLEPVYADFISLESDAVSVSAYESLLIPGLLQTAAYARAAVSALGMTTTTDHVNALVEVRIARQAVLTRPSPLKFRAIIHEAALMSSASGTSVMRDQLQRLLDVAEYPHVTIQVLPCAAQLNPGAAGAFTVLGFGQPNMNVALLEQLDSSLYVEEPSEVGRYVEAFERITAAALPFDQSLSVISKHKEAATP
ncbi:helix-turn-helix domain-containing protein [Streptomyces sp. NPDC007025]|uniref:helix-turn-helix domain-containing protein n=1 Tax=unclassified Streptomyces TaxID=2593676 RepID=UPI0036C2EE29